MLDEAIQWREAVEVPSREREPLLAAFVTGWAQPFGAPGCRAVDGESSLSSDEAGVALSRQ
eukprot:5705760-Lingulodinium_polyedra.AAC.1